MDEKSGFQKLCENIVKNWKGISTVISALLTHIVRI